MLKDRILSTLRFFDLLDYPLTLLELQQFLVAGIEDLKNKLDEHGEAREEDLDNNYEEVSSGEILECLENECQNEVKNEQGFYYLANSVNLSFQTGPISVSYGIDKPGLVKRRLANYSYGIKREKRIRRFVSGVRHIPFVRGVAVSGSQAMGLQKETSDIDLLVITDNKFLWLTRTLVTAYFHLFGIRRYGKKVADRVCLNHYLAGPKKISDHRNLYTAWEYAKLRAVAYPDTIKEFQNQNLLWINVFLPNFHLVNKDAKELSQTQKVLEKILNNRFGFWLENFFKSWELPKIRQDKFVLAREDELSFHPQSKQQELIQKFFR